MKRAWVACLVVAACDATFKFDEPRPTDDAGTDAGPDATPYKCISDATCGGLHCDVETGTCFACVRDADCSSPTPRCEPSNHVCVACLNGPDCGHRQGCDTVTNRCLDLCIDADDCLAAGFTCDEDRSLCVQCRTAANCAGSSSGPTCNSSIGRCVECKGDADCAAPRGICDRRTGKCAACVSTTSCPDGQICDAVSLVCRAP